MNPSNALVPAADASLQAGPFAHKRYVIKRPFWTLFGRVFRVYDASGVQVLKVRHPMRWRDTVKFYTDESEHTPVLFVEARKAIALNMTYDFTDDRGTHVVMFRARGLKSIVRDVWDVLDSGEQPIGILEEVGSSLLRRIFPILLGKWQLKIGDRVVMRMKQKFKFFVKEFELEVDGEGDHEAKIALGGGMLALMNEISREQRG
jgi:uncharacterized protein YxjI